MSYFAPYIDSSGFHIPTYSDIRDNLILQAQSIFGQDMYLGADSQDYQYISTISSKIYDAMQTLQMVYNSRSPSTAVGSALDGVVKINGIKRGISTYSTCPVDLLGTAGIVINNGIVADSNNVQWNLPSTVTIDPTGTVTVTATCQVSGPIAAGVGSITKIVTPVFGWTSVNNSQAATLGANAETDSQLRSRQATSTAQPSLTVLEGLKGAIAAVNGVTRYRVYENDTNTTNSLGLPPNSITAVVENGADSDIAAAIMAKKGPGCYTNGTTLINVNDRYGDPTPIRFYRPSYVDIDVTINVKKLANYTTETTALIQSTVAASLDSLGIGNGVSVSSLWGFALSAMPSLQNPLFSVTSITAARHSQTQGTNDISLAFNEVGRGNATYITVNAT